MGFSSLSLPTLGRKAGTHQSTGSQKSQSPELKPVGGGGAYKAASCTSQASESAWLTSRDRTSPWEGITSSAQSAGPVEPLDLERPALPVYVTLSK